MLVINSTEEFTPWDKTREKIYQKLPDNIQKQHRIEVGGLHDEIIAHPEAFAIKAQAMVGINQLKALPRLSLGEKQLWKNLASQKNKLINWWRNT